MNSRTRCLFMQFFNKDDTKLGIMFLPFDWMLETLFKKQLPLSDLRFPRCCSRAIETGENGNAWNWNSKIYNILTRPTCSVGESAWADDFCYEQFTLMVTIHARIIHESKKKVSNIIGIVFPWHIVTYLHGRKNGLSWAMCWEPLIVLCYPRSSSPSCWPKLQ